MSQQDRSPYSIFPAMSPEEFEAFKASIAERGVEIPAILDQDGNVIDGHNRRKACDELGIVCPVEVRAFKNEAEKYELALTLNSRRRQLNTQQKRDVIGTYLKRDPEIANNHLATILGVDSKTVNSVREGLEGTCEIPKLEKFRGQDGKVRARYHKIIANTPTEEKAALRIIGDLPESSLGKTLDITSAKRRAARSVSKIRRAEKASGPVPFGIQIHDCRFQDLEQVAGIAPASVKAIITDIPYDQGFVSQVAELAAFAERVLVEGGICAVLSGHYWLPKVMEHFSSRLMYRWMIATVWEGVGTPIHLGGSKNGVVITKWKPILLYSKGDYSRKGQFYDALLSNAKEKDWHPWQQPLVEVRKLVEFFTDPGDIVVDPCGGGFTTAVACHHLNRRCISCDIDPDCVALGRQRLAESEGNEAIPA